MPQRSNPDNSSAKNSYTFKDMIIANKISVLNYKNEPKRTSDFP